MRSRGGRYECMPVLSASTLSWTCQLMPRRWHFWARLGPTTNPTFYLNVLVRGSSTYLIAIGKMGCQFLFVSKWGGLDSLYTFSWMPSVVARPRCRTLEEWMRDILAVIAREWKLMGAVIWRDRFNTTQVICRKLHRRENTAFCSPVKLERARFVYPKNKCRNCFRILVGPIDHVGAYNWNFAKRIFATISSVALKKYKQYHLPIHNLRIFSYDLACTVPSHPIAFATVNSLIDLLLIQYLWLLTQEGWDLSWPSR